MAPAAGWYADPRRRFALRYWSGELWSSYVWSGGPVVVDGDGTAPTPSFGRRLARAFRADRASLVFAAAFLGACLGITFLGPWTSGTAAALWLWIGVPPVVLAVFARDHRWAQWLLRGVVALLVVGLLLAAAGYAAGYEDLRAMAVLLALAALAMSLLYVRPLRRLVARVVPVNPNDALHTFALQMVVLWIAYWVGMQLSGSSLDPNSYGQWGVLDPAREDLPILAAALIGAGFLIRRNLPETLERLGLRRPRWDHLVVALVVTELMIVIGVAGDWLTSLWLPGTETQLNDVSAKLYGGFGYNPLPWLVLSCSAGIAEETFFRGSLQPRLGIVLTAMLFAAVHTQYGLSFVLLGVAAGGLLLGLLRKHLSTTCSIVAHVAYDTAATLPIPGWWFLVAFAAHVVMLAIVAWRGRRWIGDRIRSLRRGAPPAERALGSQA
jgi:membrane protease YdiL (CAAX protease family)